MLLQSTTRVRNKTPIFTTVLLLSLLASMARADITSGLVLYLPMDETSGSTAHDSTANHLDATLVNMATDNSEWVSGFFGNALDFVTSKGTTQAAQVANNALLNFEGTKTFSVALWVKIPATTAAPTIIHKGISGFEQYVVDVNASGNYRFYVRNSAGIVTQINSTAAANNTWQHVVAVFNQAGSVMLLYVNGAQAASGTPPSTLRANTNPLNVGNRQTGSGFIQALNGTVDEVRVYNRALPLSDVRELYASVPQAPPPLLFTSAPSFDSTTHYVAVSVFQWFTGNDGQLSGPWRPVEGRGNWTGEPDFWRGQIKQMMAANIDVLYVHLIPNFEAQRTNLFIALNHLRAEGYDTPKVAPFLDPMITWNGQPLVNLATAAGKDEFVGQYLRFYNQYFSVSTGAYADDYVARQANKPVLDTWHVCNNCSNLSSLTRADVSSRLAAALGPAHPYFTNGFVMVTTALNPPTLSFADEKVPQFEITAYYREFNYNSIRSVQLKGGYWDQNIRNPGSFLARAGGVPYSNAWNQVSRSTTRRVYLESWNEYDEGSGMYAVTNSPPYIKPGSGNTNTDVWSASGDPFEYIKTTARGAASFNDTPWQSAKFLWHNFPTNLAPNQARTVSVIIRNTGDASWTAGQGYKFSQKDTDSVLFTTNRVLINDTQDEIPLYGGIFRGRPKTFTFTLRAPKTPGVFTTHWSMLQESVAWFGAELSVTIKVCEPAQLQTPALSPSGAVLRWNATSGVNYTLEFTDDWQSWRALAGASNLPGPLVAPFELRATNFGPLPPQRYFRVRLSGL